MSWRLAPTALRIPISRVRSLTDISMMFMITMPPTTMPMQTTAGIDGEEQGGERCPEGEQGVGLVDGEVVRPARAAAGAPGASPPRRVPSRPGSASASRILTEITVVLRRPQTDSNTGSGQQREAVERLAERLPLRREDALDRVLPPGDPHRLRRWRPPATGKSLSATS